MIYTGRKIYIRGWLAYIEDKQEAGGARFFLIDITGAGRHSIKKVLTY